MQTNQDKKGDVPPHTRQVRHAERMERDGETLDVHPERKHGPYHEAEHGRHRQRGDDPCNRVRDDGGSGHALETIVHVVIGRLIVRPVVVLQTSHIRLQSYP